MSKIQLYSLATPNGQKAGIILEELGLDYDAHTINIMNGDQFTPEFIKINPNSKIPAIVIPAAEDEGADLSIMESGAILLHLAEREGKLLSADPRLRSETIQWLFLQVGSIGPMFGQFGHFFKFAAEKCKDQYPVERYATETKRLLKVLDTRLEGRSYLVGDEYSIADISIFPWVSCLDKFYNASEKLALSDYKNVNRWLESCLSRPAVQKGMEVCAFNH
jgi:GST-like protein